MFRFGNRADPQRKFEVNKGSVKVVNDGDYKVAYDKSLQGHVDIHISADKVGVRVNKDVPNASIYLNTGGVDSVDVKVGAGTLSVGHLSQHGSYKVQTGTLDAILSKADTGKVDAKVGMGTFNNTSDLDQIGSGVSGHGFGMFGTTTTLMGDMDGMQSSFDVGCGTMFFHE